MVGAGGFERPTPCAQGCLWSNSQEISKEVASLKRLSGNGLLAKEDPVRGAEVSRVRLSRHTNGTQMPRDATNACSFQRTVETGLMHAPHTFASGVLSGFPQYSHGGPYISTL